jgi:uncharacterized repeat protein (TIGR01451 family)
MQGFRFGGNCRRAWVAIVTVFVMTGGIVGLDALPAAADASITSSGPLTQVGVGSNLNCSANHTGDTSGEFFGTTSCGTWTVVGGVLYGPPLLATGFSPTAYTPVSQTAVTGAGTSANPFKVVTVVDAGSTGVRLTQTDTYTTGLESFRTDVVVSNSSGSSQSIRLYRAADCFLQNSDSGFGSLDLTTGAVACTTGLTAGSRIEQWFPITSGSHAYEADYGSVYAQINAKQAFDDTCECTTQQDNGAGLSWDATIASGGTKTLSSLITFSPLGIEPLSMSITPSAASVAPNGTVNYTVTVHNPNTGPVTLSSLSDVLPVTFAYVANSTTGLTTANPTIGSGNTLTWAGPLVVPGSGDGTLHFTANVGSTAGTFTSSASAENTDGFTIAPSGPDGAVTVGGTTTHHLTVSVSGSGSVVSSPAGISCPTTCGADFDQTTTVGLTATPASGATFTGWSGACSGTGSCSVSMSADRTVTATFSGPETGLTVTPSATPATLTAGSIGKVHFTIRNTRDGRIGGVGATVTLPTGATPISITPSAGGCTGFTNGKAVCMFGDIAAGGTRGIDVVFGTPTGTTGPFLVSLDATSTSGTASGTGGPTVVAPRTGYARGFVPPGGSISLGNDPTADNPLVATFELPHTGPGAPITLRVESAGAGTFCGGQPCAGRKILFLSPFTGYTDPNRPPELKIKWDTSIVGTSTTFAIYVQKVDGGPITTVPNCRNYGDEDLPDIADPHPCVEIRRVHSNGDVEAHLLLLSGDPRFARR